MSIQFLIAFPLVSCLFTLYAGLSATLPGVRPGDMRGSTNIQKSFSSSLAYRSAVPAAGPQRHFIGEPLPAEFA